MRRPPARGAAGRPPSHARAIPSPASPASRSAQTCPKVVRARTVQSMEAAMARWSGSPLITAAWIPQPRQGGAEADQAAPRGQPPQPPTQGDERRVATGLEGDSGRSGRVEAKRPRGRPRG